jgi:hypothetical protein
MAGDCAWQVSHSFGGDIATGADQDVNFGWDIYYGYPPSVYDPHMTSASADLEVGANQDGVITLNVWFFG